MTSDVSQSPGRPVLTPAGSLAAGPRAKADSPWGRLFQVIRAAGPDGLREDSLVHEDADHLEDLVRTGFVTRETRPQVMLVAALSFRTGAVRPEEGGGSC